MLFSILLWNYVSGVQVEDSGNYTCAIIGGQTHVADSEVLNFNVIGQCINRISLYSGPCILRLPIQPEN